MLNKAFLEPGTSGWFPPAPARILLILGLIYSPGLGPARSGRRRAQLLTLPSTVAQRLNNAWLGLCGGAVTRSAAQGHTHTTAAGKPPDNASRGHPIRVPRARAGARPMAVCGEEMRARLLGHCLTLALPPGGSPSALDGGQMLREPPAATLLFPALGRCPRALQLEGSGFFPLSSAPRRELGTQNSPSTARGTSPPCPGGALHYPWPVWHRCALSLQGAATNSGSFPRLTAFQLLPSAFPSQKQAQLLCSQLRAVRNSLVPRFTTKTLHTSVSLGISVQPSGTSSSPFAFPRVSEASFPFWLCATSAGSQSDSGHQTAPGSTHGKGLHASLGCSHT